jgi:hypothetical protein
VNVGRRHVAILAPAIGLAAALVLVAPTPAVAADPITFGKPTADSSFGRVIEFDQPVELAAAPQRVEILLETPGAVGPGVLEVEAPAAGKSTLHFDVDLTADHVVPNTTFTARWRVTAADGTVAIGPEISQVYADDRIDWRTLEGDIVRVHWSEGNEAFGERALKIGDTAVAETSTLLGVTEKEPIDFYIYANQDEIYAALGPGTRENVGGEAHADIRTMFALISPGEIDDPWVGIVVPHELTHLVFATAVENPYHEPVHWLNEGLAVYLSEGFKASDRNAVEQVAANGTIIPLDGLAGAFPTTFERFSLAYAESVSAVDYIVETYGKDALIALIRSYAKGVSDDEAFEEAIGVDTDAFQAAWLKSVGADKPTRYGPKPGPPGPLPEGWGGAAPVPGTGSTAGPQATATPTTTAPVPDRAATDSTILPVALLAIVAVIVVALVLARRRRPAPMPAPSLWTSAPSDPSPASPPRTNDTPQSSRDELPRPSSDDPPPWQP